MALLDYCELLALLRTEEKNGKEDKEESEKNYILMEEELRKEALMQASMLGDSALFRCHKKCARIKQLTGSVLQ